ncbi:CTP synthase [[Mycoplasma] mobile]|nr:CTP synthase [[Mycoplasma] mobile]
MSKTKFIFVTGGVVSGLGKGVSAASLGNILKARGFSIFVQKLDPYLNVDPGVMSPYEHGEVFVTSDGGETDLDLGHYERFINTKFTKESNYTSGSILNNIIQREREGEFLGKTVQVIPHVTDEIIAVIKNAANKYQPDFIITEIGGTVGDIESNPFFYAIAQLGAKNRDDIFFIHVSYIIYLQSSQEWKTKPSQVSLEKLRSFGINANMLFLRSEKELPSFIREKASTFSLLSYENVIPIPDSSSIYKIPLYLEAQNVAKIILDHFKMENPIPNLEKWEKFVNLIDKPKGLEIKLAMLGKYTEFPDAYKSIVEALFVSSTYENVKVVLTWLSSENIKEDNIELTLGKFDGVVILPGFGIRGWHGKIVASSWLKKVNIPTFGICLGFQAMVIAQAREKGIKDADSAEFSKKGTMVLNTIQESTKGSSLGGTLRLGEYDVNVEKNTLAFDIYKSTKISERHRHRYEVQPEFQKILSDDEFIFSGFNKKLNTPEICEVKNLDFYLGTQYHPEFNSTPLEPQKLFSAFIQSIKKRKLNSK